MDFKGLKKLETKVVKPDFGDDFKFLNKIAFVLSFIGNIASISFASFYITDILSVAITNPIAIWSLSLLALAALELTKREIFFRFSRDFIRTATIFSASVLPMLLSTMILVSLSFYSSLSGAQKFSSKSEMMEGVADETIDTFSDSTNTYYQAKITVYEAQNQELFDANKKIDEQVDNMLVDHPTWASTAKKMREPQKENNILIEKNDAKIAEIKQERDKVIAKYSADVNAETSEDVDKNNNDSLIFVILSTLIEFIILISIYFNNLYNFKTYRDVKYKMTHDDNYRTYYEYSEVVEVMFLKRGIKDKIPDMSLMLDLLLMHKIYLTKEQVEKAMRLFDALHITETNGEYTYLLTDKKEAEDLLKEHFHIK